MADVHEMGSERNGDPALTNVGSSTDVEFDVARYVTSDCNLLNDGKDMEKKKKKKKKKNSIQTKNIEKETLVQKFSNTDEEVNSKNKVNKQVMNKDDGNGTFKNNEDKGESKKKKKRKRRNRDGDDTIVNGHEKVLQDGSIGGKIDSSSKEKKKKRKRNNVGGDINERSSLVDGEENEKDILEGDVVLLPSSKKEKKKKKRKLVEDNVEAVSKEKGGEKSHSMNGGDIVTGSKNSKTRDASRRVSFSDKVDVRILNRKDEAGDHNTARSKKSKTTRAYKGGSGVELVHGKRFSPQEDLLIQQSVYTYIQVHRLGEPHEGLAKILDNKTLRCWAEIAAALPWRPRSSVSYRARCIFTRDESKKWSPEEVEYVRTMHEECGSDWTTIATELKKHRIHVKDLYRRRLAMPNAKKGHWSQDEYQNLFTLVNEDLQKKAFEEKKSKHGMLRDNIGWEKIGRRLGTREGIRCFQKWYDQLSSPMVGDGVWSDTDDYRLLIELSNLDACCLEEVDWDSLLEHRDGDVCRKRWGQMVKHIGQYGIKSFPEQVDLLSTRYCADLLRPREIYEKKQPVD